MPTKHKFYDRAISPRTETLIVGTFNPDAPNNNADFFYGRKQNHLWRILPIAFGEKSLKNSKKEEKIIFCEKYKIDFIDLIAEVSADRLEDFKDKSLEKIVTKWRDIKEAIEKTPNLKRIALTRKTFSGIPNIKAKWLEIEKHYKNRLLITRLITPARIYDDNKQAEWNRFLKAR
ncbi:MAG: hypothetical protein LBP89_03465 [Helicobacteraceae bacterium]|jgi:G:T/U-mismatch repair DNA glycosylase|nr:hypothetical protein [Helicobacteraceae bacterium]